MGNFKDLTGIKFGKLLVVELDKENDKSYKKWICLCDCGKKSSVRTAALKNGHTTSCGCSIYEKKYSYVESNARSRWCILKNEISFDDFMEISQQNCHWCGDGPSTISSIKNRGELYMNNPFIWNGLDRIDNNKDHNKDNVVPCCATCNISRNIQTPESFLSWIDKVYSFQKSKREKGNNLT